jgi:phospholipase C
VSCVGRESHGIVSGELRQLRSARGADSVDWVSPFSKPSYVSHTVGDHTSLLALIEKRFLNSSGTPLHLTKRDASANDLESMFDFTHSPSLNTAVGQAQPPVNDCTPQ